MQVIGRVDYLDLDSSRLRNGCNEQLVSGLSCTTAGRRPQVASSSAARRTDWLRRLYAVLLITRMPHRGRAAGGNGRTDNHLSDRSTSAALASIPCRLASN